MKTLATIALALTCAAMTSTVSAGDPAAGQAKSAACAACHGANGISTIPNYPNLAGQKETYLVEAMKAYKSGARTNPIMKPMATMLSDTDIENVAAYYASLACK